MKIELWKMIPGYEGLYMVSNFGRVKSLNYNHTGEEKIMKPYRNGDGHLQVELWKNGKTTQPYVHVLVASAFIPIPDKYKGIPAKKLDVHHINFVTDDNRPENLCWLTKREHHAIHKGTPVEQCTKDGNVVAEYPSMQEAARQTGFCQSCISQVCNGIRKSTGGFFWKFKEPQAS